MRGRGCTLSGTFSRWQNALAGYKAKTRDRQKKSGLLCSRTRELFTQRERERGRAEWWVGRVRKGEGGRGARGFSGNLRILLKRGFQVAKDRAQSRTNSSLLLRRAAAAAVGRDGCWPVCPTKSNFSHNGVFSVCTRACAPRPLAVTAGPRTGARIIYEAGPSHNSRRHLRARLLSARECGRERS